MAPARPKVSSGRRPGRPRKSGFNFKNTIGARVGKTSSATPPNSLRSGRAYAQKELSPKIGNVDKGGPTSSILGIKRGRGRPRKSVQVDMTAGENELAPLLPEDPADMMENGDGGEIQNANDGAANVGVKRGRGRPKKIVDIGIRNHGGGLASALTAEADKVEEEDAREDRDSSGPAISPKHGQGRPWKAGNMEIRNGPDSALLGPNGISTKTKKTSVSGKVNADTLILERKRGRGRPRKVAGVEVGDNHALLDPTSEAVPKTAESPEDEDAQDSVSLSVMAAESRPGEVRQKKEVNLVDRLTTPSPPAGLSISQRGRGRPRKEVTKLSGGTLTADTELHYDASQDLGVDRNLPSESEVEDIFHTPGRARAASPRPARYDIFKGKSCFSPRVFEIAPEDDEVDVAPASELSETAYRKHHAICSNVSLPLETTLPVFPKDHAPLVSVERPELHRTNGNVSNAAGHLASSLVGPKPAPEFSSSAGLSPGFQADHCFGPAMHANESAQ